jgi:non-specific serine/threonine protein kinase/serine/threonine-protein kinase
MGAVYEAQQKQPRRLVALKLIRSGIASPSALKRFEYEAQLLARLRHPGIAQVYEAGTHDDGTGPVPFFAMEYVARALPITEYVSSNQLTTRQRLELFIQVCDAVHHGHQKGIIHRDLKPSNILVDSTAQPKVIDFGVARSTDSDLGTATLLTSVGQLVGTPQYMSPEQCQADPQDIDTRSDVYALGIVLYEMLCGKLPYDVSRAPIHEAARMIQEQPPVRPSTLSKSLRGDLETIVLKALEKDRRRRYQSAADLALDLQRYLKNEPILARPTSAIYQLRKFAQRNRAMVTGVAGIIVALAAGVVVSTLLFFRSEASREEAEAVVLFLGGMLADVDPRVGSKDITVREVLDRASSTVGHRFSEKPLVEAYLHHVMADSYLGLGLWDEAEKHAAAAARLRRDSLGDEHPARFESMRLLAYALDRQAKFAQAYAVLDELIPLSRRILGEESPETLDAMYRKAEALLEDHRRDEAGALHRKVYEIRRRVLGDQDPLTISSLYAVGVVTIRRGRASESEPIFRQVLRDRQRVLGPEHPDSLHAMNNIGWALFQVGKFAESADMHQQTLEIRRRVLGNLHPDTLRSMHNLADPLEVIGRHEEAQRLYQEAIEGYRKVLGEDHPRILSATNQYAWGMLTCEPSLRDPQAALALAERVVEKDHRSNPYFLDTLALAQFVTGDAQRAFATQQDSLALLPTGATTIGPGLLRDLARDMLEARRIQKLTPVLLELHEKRPATAHETPPRMPQFMAHVIDFYDTWNRIEPGHGYDAKAAQWQAKRSEIQ